MSEMLDALWLNVSPALEKFDRPLLRALAANQTIAQWQYSQSQDEPISLEAALRLLHDYLRTEAIQPIHLLGHGTGGLLALLYARRYPERVRSLTLLAVGVYPTVDWQAHYYAQLQSLPCSRQTLLTQTVYNLFGYQSRSRTQDLVKLLERDLSDSLSPHTLYRRVNLFPHRVPVPLLVCGSQDDAVVDPNLLQGWLPWLKPIDRLWECPNGRYFFHYFHPQPVSEQILDFWHSQQQPHSIALQVPAQFSVCQN